MQQASRLPSGHHPNRGRRGVPLFSALSLLAVCAAWLLGGAAARAGSQRLAGGPVATTSSVPSSDGSLLDVGGADRGEVDEATLMLERAAAFAEPRVYPAETFPAGALLNARRQALRLLSAPFPDRRPFLELSPHRGPFTFYRPVDHRILGRWINYGPAPICSGQDCTTGAQPYSGRITAIATDPAAPGTLYIGSPGGGVWRTRNGGVHWTPLFDRMPSMAIGALALDPKHPATVFAGTGDGNGLVSAGYMGVGLFRSQDEGKHWSRVGGSQFDGCAFHALKIHPDYDRVVVAAVSVDPTYGGPGSACVGGVYLSTDGGTTWSRWLARSQVDDVAFGKTTIKPIASDQFALGIPVIQVFAGVHDEGLYSASLALPTTIGASAGGWQQVGGGLPSANLGAVRIAVAPSDRRRAYVLVQKPDPNDPTIPRGAWTSGDGGQSWTPFDPPPNAYWTLLSLAVDPTNPDTLYEGSGDLWRVDNAGGSFTDLSQGNKLHVDMPSLAFDTLHRLYIGTDGGLARTSDDQSFESANGDLSISQINPGISGTLQGNGALAPGGPFLAGVEDHGVAQYSGTQGTLRWQIVLGGDGGYTAIDPTHPGTEYASVQALLGLFKTDDYFQSGSGTNVKDVRWNTEYRAFITPFVMDTARPDHLYVGTQKVYRSKDAAGSWHVISPDFGSKVTALAPAVSDGQAVYAGIYQTGIETTPDGGGNWQKGKGVPDRWVNDVAVNPADASEAWAALGGFGAAHLVHTTDEGQSWTDVSGDLPDAPVNAVAVDIRYEPPALFVGTDVGVFLSTDGGAHWLVSGGGLPNAPVTDLLLDTGQNQLVAGTYGRGVWAATEHVFRRFRRPPFVGPPVPVFGGGGG